MAKKNNTENIVAKKDDLNFPILTSIEQIEDSEIKKKNCKICNSKFRRDAEVQYEKTKNITAVYKYLNNEGLEISYPAVRNHIVNHYKAEERNIKVKEYSSELRQWLGKTYERRSVMRERIAILTREMALIASETEGLGLDQRRKSADAIKKLSDTITALEDKIDVIDGVMEPVNIIVGHLNNIIREKIERTQSNETKKALIDVLQSLSERVEDLYI